MKSHSAALTRSQPLLQFLPILAVLLLAAFVRLIALDHQPLRGDEAFTLENYVNRPLDESLREVAPVEPVPPGIYAMYRAWGLWVGKESLWSFRLFPAFSNLIGVAAVYTLGRSWGSKRIALIAALVWAIMPAMIWQAQDARNYAQWVSVSTLAVVQGLRVFKARTVSWRGWLPYALYAGLALMIAYQEAAILISLAVFTIGTPRKKGKRLQRLLFIQGALLGFTAIVFLTLQGDLLWSGGYGGNLEFISLGEMLALPTTLIFLDLLPVSMSYPVGALIWLVGIFSVVWLWRTEKRRQELIFSISLLILPVFMLSIAGLNWQVFHARYVLASAMGLALLVALLWDRLWQKRRVLAVCLSLLIFGAFSYGLMQYFDSYRKAVDWGTLVEWMSEMLTPTDVVIQQSRDPAFSWHFAHTATGAREVNLPVHPEQQRDEIEQALANLTGHQAIVWTVGREFQDWPNQGVVQDWLSTNRQVWFQGESDGIPYAAYLPVEPSSDEINRMVHQGEIFGQPGVVELRGYILDTTPDALLLRLFWVPIQQSDVPLKVFIHLVRMGERQPSAQADKPPLIATDFWPSGEMLREIYMLPKENLPAGDYSIHVGWYDPVTGIRLPVNGQDSIQLTSVSIP